MNKSHPILFRPDVVRAILNCKPGVWPAEPIDPALPMKFQTRRVVKPQPLYKAPWYIITSKKPMRLKNGVICSEFKTNVLEKVTQALSGMPCPYGVPGEELWVREQMKCIRELSTGGVWFDVKFSADGAYSNDDRHDQPSGDQTEWFINYRNWYDAGDDTRVIPSIHMPRWACRLHLEVKRVRVGRVQEISYKDCSAEGIHEDGACNDYGAGGRVRDAFAALWDSINAKRGYSWESNPWVWAVDFMRKEEMP